jgi:hypothetical protein
MSDLSITDAEVAKLTRLADVLIPGTAVMPAVADIPSFADLLRAAVKACGYSREEVRAALDAIPAEVDWEGARDSAARSPRCFEVASLLASAAYYMAPMVLDRLNYPIERRHPAADDEFAEEYGTGILDPVTARGRNVRMP